LALPIALQCFQPVPGQGGEIVQQDEPDVKAITSVDRCARCAQEVPRLLNFDVA
jgi:hypothetical protein